MNTKVFISDSERRGLMQSGERISPDSRIAPRFTPAYSVSAAILDGDFHVIQGVVANISETGASLVTNRDVLCGPDVKLKISQHANGLFETEARVVWASEGICTTQEVAGALLGLSFLEISSTERDKIRQFFLDPEEDVTLPRELAPVEPEPVPVLAEPLVDLAQFDLLIDPTIDELFSTSSRDTEKELYEIRQRLEPYLRRASNASLPGRRHSRDARVLKEDSDFLLTL